MDLDRKLTYRVSIWCRYIFSNSAHDPLGHGWTLKVVPSSSLNILSTTSSHWTSAVTQIRRPLLSRIHEIWQDFSGEDAASGSTSFLKVSLLFSLYLSQVRRVPLQITKLFFSRPRDLKLCMEVTYMLWSAAVDLNF